MEDYALDTNDIAPIIGQMQLRILTMSKTIEKMQARIKELEAADDHTNGSAKEHVFEAERREINGLVRN